MLDTLLENMPPHETYVEVFGGAASFLFAKPQAPVLEVYNDLDSGLVTFFRVLRSERETKRLQRLLNLTPYAYDEWRDCMRTWAEQTDQLERARRWYVALVGSFGKHIGQSSGWSFSKTPNHSKATSFRTTAAELERFSKRMRGVQVDHCDFERCIKRYDLPDTLFYVDPPYMPETRSRADRYRHEMTVDDHKRLLALLVGVKGKVMLSGYRSRLYDAELDRAGWRRVDTRTLSCSANKVRGERIECLWLSPTATAHQPELPWGMEQEMAEAAV